MGKIFVLIVVLGFLLVPCRGEYMETVKQVDIERFMGDWYVQGIIPNFIEKHAINGIESYSLIDENRVKIDYRFTDRRTGKVKHMEPKAWIYNKKTYAEWRVQFIWPIKFPYLIIDLADDYSYTVIGVPNRKFVWIMSRQSQMSDAVYNGILERLQLAGYKIDKIVRMPQEWEQ